MKKITVFEGDGIGPEVVQAACKILKATKAPLAFDYQVAGKKAFEEGFKTGVTDAALESIYQNKTVLKGPLETPVGHGDRSANVTLRKLCQTYANIRPAKHFPHISSHFQDVPVDLIVIRENLEDLYAGIEHQQTPSVAQSLKVMTSLGCERICRFAFEYALSLNRKKVTCVTKANIMKLTEGMLKSVFERCAKDYPQLEADHMIVDNCAHQLVISPDQFDMIVTSNLNGDILSDLTSGLVGGLGIAASANIGSKYSIFEAVHGSAPDIAGQNSANPMALIFASMMMLHHLEFVNEAKMIETALISVLKEDLFTKDLAPNKETAVSTSVFADAIIAAMVPVTDFVPHHTKFEVPSNPLPLSSFADQYSKLKAVDIFISSKQALETVVSKLASCLEGTPFSLQAVWNRGTLVYPDLIETSDYVDQWQCQFSRQNGDPLTTTDIRVVLDKIEKSFEWMHIEKVFDTDD